MCVTTFRADRSPFSCSLVTKWKEKRRKWWVSRAVEKYSCIDYNWWYKKKHTYKYSDRLNRKCSPNSSNQINTIVNSHTLLLNLTLKFFFLKRGWNEAESDHLLYERRLINSSYNLIDIAHFEIDSCKRLHRIVESILLIRLLVLFNCSPLLDRSYKCAL